MKNSKFTQAAKAEYIHKTFQSLRNGLAMIEHLAELYEALHKLDPENYHIDSHWVFAKEQEQ